MLTWLKNFTRNRPPPIEAVAVETSLADTPALLRLPQELLDHIVHFLDLSEAVCLSLCSKDLRWRLGTYRWQTLRPRTRHHHEREWLVAHLARERLLAHLARDNPDLFFCYGCSRLHLVANVGPAIDSVLLFPRVPCLEPGLICNTLKRPFEIYGGDSHCEITFPHVQATMARHRQRHLYEAPLSLLSLTEIQREYFYKVWGLIGLEPSVIDNELFLRVQQWIIIDLDDPPKFERIRCPSICEHINSLIGSTMLELIQCQLQHVGKRATCPKCRLLYRCTHCAMEYESTAISIGDRTVAVVITKWLNLGDGSSPTDPHWKRHLHIFRHVRRPFGQPVAIEDDWRGVRSKFEEQTTIPLRMAMWENALLLVGESFRRKLHPFRSRDVWRKSNLMN